MSTSRDDDSSERVSASDGSEAVSEVSGVAASEVPAASSTASSGLSGGRSSSFEAPAVIRLGARLLRFLGARPDDLVLEREVWSCSPAEAGSRAIPNPNGWRSCVTESPAAAGCSTAAGRASPA